MIKDLTRRLDDLQACNDLMMKQGSALQRALVDLEMLEPPSLELAAKVKIVSERATLFRIAANAMINVSSNDNPCEIEQRESANTFPSRAFSKFCNSGQAPNIVQLENPFFYLEFLFFLPRKM